MRRQLADGWERGDAGLLPRGMRAGNLFAPELLNRMKFKPIGRTVKASILSLAMALGVTACSNDYTVSYVYLATSKSLPHGLINSYQIDYQSGSLLPLANDLGVLPLPFSREQDGITLLRVAAAHSAPSGGSAGAAMGVGALRPSVDPAGAPSAGSSFGRKRPARRGGIALAARGFDGGVDRCCWHKEEPSP